MRVLSVFITLLLLKGWVCPTKMMTITSMMTMVMIVACHSLAAFVDMAECFWGVQVGDVGVEKALEVRDDLKWVWRKTRHRYIVLGGGGGFEKIKGT
jgi:hypothetical protein